MSKNGSSPTSSIEFCPYCRKRRACTLFNIVNSYELYICRLCTTVFTKVSESRKDVNTDVYTHAYIASYLKRKKSLIKRFKKRVEDIEGIKKTGTLLDYGCSTGMFLKAVSLYGKGKWKLYGADINKKSISVAKKELPDGKFTFSELTPRSFPQHFFDCITCFDVLEHDEHIKKTLSIFKKILKPDGILVVQCPNYKSIMTFLCRNNWDWWSVPDHIFHFSFDQLKRVLNENGFAVVSAKTWDPKEDVVKNMQGSIKTYFPKVLMFNKVAAKILWYPLYIFWLAALIPKTILNIGALSVIIVKKS